MGYVPTCFYRSDDMPELVRLVYASYSSSTASLSGIQPEIGTILTQSRKNNARAQISGVLYFGDGCFFQCLEGEESRVKETYTHSTGSPSYGCCDYSSGSDTTTDVQRLVDEVRSCRAGRPGLLAGSRDGPVRSDEYGCGCYRRFVEAFPDCQQQRCSGSTCSGTGPEPNSQ